MNLLLITLTGKAILVLVIIFILIIALWIGLKKDAIIYDEIYPPDDFDKDKIITFQLQNNTDEEIKLDLCRLDKNDNRYSFSVSGGEDYDMLIEYLKLHSLFVNGTRVNYGLKNTWSGFGLPDWYKNFIYLKNFTPFEKSNTPIFIACDDISENQFQLNVIQSVGSYSFDYLNSLEIKLLPKDTMQISLFCSDYNKSLIKKPIKCSLSIKNTGSEKQVVELFKLDYFKNLEENKNNGIEINSIFGKEHYRNVAQQFNNIPLIATNVKFILTKENKNSICKINLREFPICNYVSINQFQSNVINCPLENETYILNMSIEIEPNTEMLISIK